LDASSYCFVFPSLGAMPPNLTVTVQKFADPPVLEEFVASRTDPMFESLENFEVLSEVRNQRDNWNYIVNIVCWATNGVVTRQKRLYIYVPEPVHAIYVLVATDLAENAGVSDPVIDNIIRSFQPAKSH